MFPWLCPIFWDKCNGARPVLQKCPGKPINWKKKLGNNRCHMSQEKVIKFWVALHYTLHFPTRIAFEGFLSRNYEPVSTRQCEFGSTDHERKLNERMIRMVLDSWGWWLEQIFDLTSPHPSAQEWWNTPISQPERRNRILRGLKYFVRSRALLTSTRRAEPPRTVSVQNLPLSLGVWKPPKTHAMCFIASGNLCSGSFQSQQELLENIVT